MSRWRFIILISVMLLLVVVCGIFVNNYQGRMKKEKEEQIQRQFENYALKQEEQYTYPQGEDENEGISRKFTADILVKVSEGNELIPKENDLLIYYKVQDSENGYAVTRWIENDGGMGKATRRAWGTTDGGATWDMLKEEIYSTGIYDYVFIDSVLIENAFATTAEKGTFNISKDYGKNFVESIPYQDVFAYDGVAYAKKVGDDVNKKTVVYKWIDFHTQHEISTIEYDLELNVINVLE